MLEFSEKYKAYAEEFPDAIVCWKHPGECHTEEGQKVIETYNQHYGAVAFEILYEVRAMLSDSTLGKIYSLVDEDEDMAFNKLRELLGKPIIYPEDELFYYYEPPYRNIKSKLTWLRYAYLRSSIDSIYSGSLSYRVSSNPHATEILDTSLSFPETQLLPVLTA